MKYEVRIEEQAVSDIEAIVVWIASDSPANARRWHERLQVAIASLSSMPKRAPLAPEDEEIEVEIRQLIFGRRSDVYRILFTLQGRTVHVFHVRHAARRPLR